MIKAKVTLRTVYGEAVIHVEVLLTSTRRGCVWVRTLDGSEPFGQYSTMSGSYGLSTCIVPVPQLSDIQHVRRTEMNPRKHLIEAIDFKDRIFEDYKIVTNRFPDTGCYYPMKTLYEQAVAELDDAREQWEDAQSIPVELPVNVNESSLQ